MFKKLMCATIAMAVVMPTFASQDIYITFKNGKTAVYKNVDDSVTNEDFNIQLVIDHGLGMDDIDPHRSKIISTSLDAPEQSGKPAEVSFWDTGWGTTTKVVIGIVVLGALWKLSAPASKGCANPWNIAKDGSRCGLRSAASRPGGR